MTDEHLSIIRERMIETAALDVMEQGINVQIGDLDFKSIAERSEVSRSNAYRAFRAARTSEAEATSPKELLRLAVIESLLRQHPGGGPESTAATLDSLAELEQPNPEDFAKMDDAGKSELLRTIIRVGAGANYAAVHNDKAWTTVIALTAGLSSRGFERLGHGIQDAWQDGEQKLAFRYKETYEMLTELFGWRLRPSYSWAQFDTAAAALVEGLAIRAQVSEYVDNIPRMTGPAGTSEPWTLFAVCFEGLVRQFMEPNPDAPDGMRSFHFE